MSRKRAEQKRAYKKIASYRIHQLFSLAQKNAHEGNLLLANRYIALARRISMKYLVALPSQYKRRFCTHCYCYLLPSQTSQVRIKRGMIITFCKTCKNINRVPLPKRYSKSKRS